MNPERLPSRHLPNKPLVEAIFELRWALQKDQDSDLNIDPGFQLLVGRYYERVRQDYPFIQELPISKIPENMTAYTVRNRFRADRNRWPVTQIGPGILTVNETEGYNWHSFQALLEHAVKALYESYPTEIRKLTPTRVLLRYMNAIEIDGANPTPNIFNFLSELLHTRIEIEPKLFKDSTNPPSPKGLNLNITFPLDNIRGTGTLVFALGKKEDKPSLIWEIAARSEETDTPQSVPELHAWLEEAHGTIENWFFTLARGKLMEGFELNNEN